MSDRATRDGNSGSTYEEPELSLEQDDTLVGESLSDGYAMALVSSTYELQRQFRWRSHDPRWSTSDALYSGWQPMKFWDGTRIERSHLGYPIVFDQVESALPIILNALFGDDDWFQVTPSGQTSLEQARQVQERLRYLLDTPNDQTGTNARVQASMSVKQVLLYGNGFASLDYDSSTGNPTFNWLDTRDLYIDPGCTTPYVDDCKSTIRRFFLTVDQLEAMRGSPGVKLPPFEQLKLWADERPFDSSDITKQQQEIFRQVIYRPGFDDLTLFLANKQLEVLCYTDEDRIIWQLQRRWIMYNELNPYHFINQVGAPCYPVTGRLYAMGFGDVLELNQKYAQAIVNGRLDELQLSLNPPRIKRRAADQTPTSKQLRPGLEWTAENPKEDMVFFPPQNVTQNGWQELAHCEATAEKRTGVTQLLQQGQPMRANASRTATGIQAQAAGPTSRLQQIVSHVEDYMIVPALYKLVAMDRYHATQTKLRGLTPSGSYSDVPVSALTQPVRFKMEASSRMLNQSRLREIIPFMSQYLMNGPFLAQLAKAGQTVDFGEFFNMLQDATGTRGAYRLVRQMTPQEQQQASQPPPEAIMKQQQAADANKTRMDIMQIKAAVQQQQISEGTATKLLEILHDMEQAQVINSQPQPAAPPTLPGV